MDDPTFWQGFSAAVFDPIAPPVCKGEAGTGGEGRFDVGRGTEGRPSP